MILRAQAVLTVSDWPGVLGVSSGRLRSSMVAVTALACGRKTVGPQALRLFGGLFRAESVLPPRLDNCCHFVEVAHVENHVDSIVPILNHADACEGRELIGDSAPAIGGSAQKSGPVGVNVAIPTTDHYQTGISLGSIFILQAVALAPSLF